MIWKSDGFVIAESANCLEHFLCLWSNTLTCIHVFCILGTVKKCALLKIVHEQFKQSKRANDNEYIEYIQSFDEAVENNKEIEPLLGKTAQVCKIIYFLQIQHVIQRSELKFI